MTAQPHDLPPAGTPDPAKSLRAIRAALVVRQDREAFDAGLKNREVYLLRIEWP